MIKLKKVYDRIIDIRKLDSDNCEITLLENEGYNFSTLEGINTENSAEEKYLIYNCSESGTKFNYNQYTKISSNTADSIPIFLFKNWDDEMGQYYECYDNLDNNNKRKKLADFFNEKISFYTDLIDIKDKLRLYVNVPENFNEYIPDGNSIDAIEGYIYNFSLKELKKLFNITGRELFKENVRRGLNKNITVDEIKKSFRNYLYSYIYLEIKDKYDGEKKNLDLIREIENELEITFSYMNCPKYFWFYHNGITIFSYDEKKIDRSGSCITLNPNHVSVINGAQTLTNFYLELENVKRKAPKILSRYGIDKTYIHNLLEEAYDKTIVKTILISGKKEFVKPITYGLNSQVPVLNEHILADSIEVSKINLILKKGSMEILKEGDFSIYGKGMNVLEFTKKYLVIEKKPGKSKNLSKKDIFDILNESLSKIQKNENFYLSAFELLLDLDVWWQKSKKNRDLLYKKENYKIINSYGKNYFGSYIINKYFPDNNSYDYNDDYYEIQYSEFVKKFGDKDISLSLSDFKKDDLFNDYIISIIDKDVNEVRNINNYIKLDELKDYLNTLDVSAYAVSSAISEYLNKNEIELEYFRVIKRIEKKCKEAYPFPNSCFNEIYLNKNCFDEENDNFDLKLDFENSKFEKEISNIFPVFVLEYTKNNNGVNNIQYIPEFTFQSYRDEAKKVFDLTIDAFFEGDELSFPKTSDNLCFHVRPKAINSKDTFEFTNGEQITKRTFWANKSTVEMLSDNFLKNKNK